MFSQMYNNMKFEGQRSRINWQESKDWYTSWKIICGRHKFVFKKKDDENEFILITYMYKTDLDLLEWWILNTIRYWQWKN